MMAATYPPIESSDTVDTDGTVIRRVFVDTWHSDLRIDRDDAAILERYMALRQRSRDGMMDARARHVIRDGQQPMRARRSARGALGNNGHRRW